MFDQYVQYHIAEYLDFDSAISLFKAFKNYKLHNKFFDDHSQQLKSYLDNLIWQKQKIYIKNLNLAQLLLFHNKKDQYGNSCSGIMYLDSVRLSNKSIIKIFEQVRLYTTHGLLQLLYWGLCNGHMAEPLQYSTLCQLAYMHREKMIFGSAINILNNLHYYYLQNNNIKMKFNHLMVFYTSKTNFIHQQERFKETIKLLLQGTINASVYALLIKHDKNYIKHLKNYDFEYDVQKELIKFNISNLKFFKNPSYDLFRELLIKSNKLSFHMASCGKLSKSMYEFCISYLSQKKLTN